MTQPEKLVDIWRGGHLESQHFGHVVVCDASGEVREAWGDPDLEVFPRSSCKMLQALPLIESGAAKAFGLKSEHLALACASHQGASIHTDRVTKWLAHLQLDDTAFRCGAQEPSDKDARDELIRNGQSPCQMHNNCSGKHSGFLTLARHLGAGPEYLEIDHPVQLAVRQSFEEMTGMASPGYGIDGCSAPNFLTTLTGLARAMAKMTGSSGDGARAQLVNAMMKHPDLVAGEGRACTELMRAANHRAAIKTGAEGVFVAILPDQRLGIAIKAADGTTRAAEAAVAAMLIRYDIVDREDPAAKRRLSGPITNWRGIETGEMRTNPHLMASV